MTSPGDEFTDSSSVSTFRVAKKLFGGTRSADQGSLTSERSSIDKSTPGSTYDKTSPAALMHESAHNPHVLIGCRIYINGKGQGTIIGMRKRKFSSSKFRISFDSNPSESVELKLRRRAGRSGEDFQILPRNSWYKCWARIILHQLDDVWWLRCIYWHQSNLRSPFFLPFFFFIIRVRMFVQYLCYL